MSNRSSIANVAKARRPRRGARSCVWALAILAMTWTGVPETARADAIVLRTGESIDGSIVDATRNTVIIRRAIGGMRQMRIQDIAEVRLDLAQGERIAGQLLGWADGVHEVRSGGEIVRIGAGRILTRERRDDATTTPPGLPPRPLAPRLGKVPTVQAAAAAAPAPEVERAKLTRAAAAEAPPATDRATKGTPAKVAGAEDIAPTAASVLARPTQIAAAAGAPAVDGRAGGATIAAAEVRAAAVTPAAAAVPEVVPVVLPPSQASAAGDAVAEIAGAGTSPAGGDPAKPAVAALPPAEASATDRATRPEEEKDDQPLAVKGTVDPAEAGADGILFRFELSRPAEQPVVLIYGTVDGTAVAGKDYEPRQGVVTVTPGSRSAEVRVPLIEHRRSRVATFELFLTADPKVATVVDQRISATIPAAGPSASGADAPAG